MAPQTKTTHREYDKPDIGGDLQTCQFRRLLADLASTHAQVPTCTRTYIMYINTYTHSYLRI